MAVNTPFQPLGKTISLTAGVTAQSRQILQTDFGLPGMNTPFPPHMRVVNRGSADIWLSFTGASTTIVIPTPGTNTVGTPQQAIIVVSGVVEVFTLPTGAVLWVQDISLSASQTYHLTIGEGL